MQVLSTLPALASLTVGGKPIEDTAAYLKEQKETVDLYNSVIGWFESGDYNTLKVVLQQFTNADSLGGAVLSVGLFTARVPAGPLTALNSPLCVPAVLVLILAVAWLSPVRGHQQPGYRGGGPLGQPALGLPHGGVSG